MKSRYATSLAGLAFCLVASPVPAATEGTLEVEQGVLLFYRIAGEGTQTVIVPDASYLAPDLEPLARGRRLIFYDLRGRGRSGPIKELSRIGVDRDLDDLEAIRRHFALERISLIGHSYMGALIVLYARRHRERVDRLLLIDPMELRRDPYAARQSPADKGVNQVALRKLRRMRRAGLNTKAPVAYCRQWDRAYLGHYVAAASALARIRTPCELPNEWPDKLDGYFAARQESFGNWDWRPAAAHVQSSTLVAWGTEDFIAAGSSREWVAALPDAHLLVIPRAGHMSHAERPDLFLPAAERFLRSGGW